MGVTAPVPHRLIRSYYLYQATALVFFQVVFFPFYEQRVGLSVPTILWLQSYDFALRAALDLPFGAVADRFSRRACLAVSALAVGTASTLLLVWPTFLAALLAETLFATAGALRSGADSALLFDGLKAADRLDLYPRAESRAQAIVSLAAGTTAVVGSLLAAVDLRWPYAVTIPCALASAGFAWRLGAEPRRRDETASPLGLAREAFRLAGQRPAVQWAIALAVFAIVTSHVYYFVQQPYLEGIGIPVALFGVVFLVTKAVTAVVATRAYRIDAALGPRWVAVTMAGTALVGLGGMSVTNVPAGALLILTRGIIDGLWQPLVNLYMNRLVDSRLRATMLSLQSVAARLGLSAALALLGVATARSGLGPALGAAAVAAVLAGGTLALLAPRAPRGLPAEDRGRAGDA